MSPIFAIAEINFRKNIRQAPFWALALASILTGPLLTAFAAADGSEAGKVLLFLKWSLAISTFGLSLLAIILAADAMCAEFANSWYTLLAVRPVRSYEIIVGKWLAVVGILLLFMLLSFLLTLGFLRSLDFSSLLSIFFAYIFTWLRMWLLAAVGITAGVILSSGSTAFITFTVLTGGYVNSLRAGRYSGLELSAMNRLSRQLLYLLPKAGHILPGYTANLSFAFSFELSWGDFIDLGILHTLVILALGIILLPQKEAGTA